MARFDSAPPILSSRLPAWRRRPGRGGTARTIVSPAVITLRFSANCGLSSISSRTRTARGLIRSEKTHVRPDACPELGHELGVGAEPCVGVFCKLPEVGDPVFQPFADHAVDLPREVEGAVEEVQNSLALHRRVVGRQEVTRTHGVEGADGVLVAGGVEVARWEQ